MRTVNSFLAPVFVFCSALLIDVLLGGAQANAQEGASSPLAGKLISKPAVTLSVEQWKQLDSSVDRGLKFLATTQELDGSFPTLDLGQPAVTSLCVMAFLSRGHLPNEGPYGAHIAKGIDYVLKSQQPNGLFYLGEGVSHLGMIVGTYNHAIAGVMLGEVYGMTGKRQQDRIRPAIQRALRFTDNLQDASKDKTNFGGWRYLVSDYTSDLSVSAWHLMFYRSARNAEFDVADKRINDSLAFIEKCYNPQRGTFSYGVLGDNRNNCSRGMAGAGIVSLALAGKHDTEMARKTGRFILDHPFDRFNRGGLTREDRFYYGAYYCSQAMFQLGGEYWAEYFRVFLNTMVENQDEDGSWAPEANQDAAGGTTYSTSFAILALTPPYQLLPIYQR